MKGITKGEWVIDERFTNEHGVDVVSIRMWNDKRDIISAIHVFESKDGGTAENEAELICTAGNLTNAGYNIEAMPQLVEALEELIKTINPQDVVANKMYNGLNLGEYYVGSRDTPSEKSIHMAINALKSAKL